MSGRFIPHRYRPCWPAKVPAKASWSPLSSSSFSSPSARFMLSKRERFQKISTKPNILDLPCTRPALCSSHQLQFISARATITRSNRPVCACAWALVRPWCLRVCSRQRFISFSSNPTRTWGREIMGDGLVCRRVQVEAAPVERAWVDARWWVAQCGCKITTEKRLFPGPKIRTGHFCFCFTTRHSAENGQSFFFQHF